MTSSSSCSYTPNHLSVVFANSTAFDHQHSCSSMFFFPSSSSSSLGNLVAPHSTTTTTSRVRVHFPVSN
ncbi:hypothetical protein TYRP_021357 [Tyrophagus putrescentiae]|nr:hypothetical protein TYRP_021357 [Tyrophagus putrescentiae]